MDGRSVSSKQLYERLGLASAPFLVDVRRADAFGADDVMIIGAMRGPAGDFTRPVNFPDEHEMLKHGMVIYDALYTLAPPASANLVTRGAIAASPF